jgi:hypothetical protein
LNPATAAPLRRLLPFGSGYTLLIEKMIPSVNPECRKTSLRKTDGSFCRSSGSEKPEQPVARRVFTSRINQGIVQFDVDEKTVNKKPRFVRVINKYRS